MFVFRFCQQLKTNFEIIFNELHHMNSQWMFQMNSASNLPIVVILKEGNPNIALFKLVYDLVGEEFFENRLKQLLFASRYTMGVICNYVVYEMKSLIEWTLLEERRRAVLNINRIVSVFGNDLRWAYTHRTAANNTPNKPIFYEIPEKLSIVSVLENEMDDKLMAWKIVYKLMNEFNIHINDEEKKTVIYLLFIVFRYICHYFFEKVENWKKLSFAVCEEPKNSRQIIRRSSFYDLPELMSPRHVPSTSVSSVNTEKDLLLNFFKSFPDILNTSLTIPTAIPSPNILRKRSATVESDVEYKHLELIYSCIVEVLSVGDLVTDMIVLEQLIATNNQWWTSFMLLFLLAPYLVSYCAFASIFQSHDKNISLFWKICLITPLSLFLLIIVDLLFMMYVTVCVFILMMTCCCAQYRKKLIYRMETDWIFEKLKMSEMDIKGYRRLRTLSQLMYALVCCFSDFLEIICHAFGFCGKNIQF